MTPAAIQSALTSACPDAEWEVICRAGMVRLIAKFSDGAAALRFTVQAASREEIESIARSTGQAWRASRKTSERPTGESRGVEYVRN